MRATSSTPQQRSWCRMSGVSNRPASCPPLGLMQRTKCREVLRRGEGMRKKLMLGSAACWQGSIVRQQRVLAPNFRATPRSPPVQACHEVAQLLPEARPQRLTAALLLPALQLASQRLHQRRAAVLQ